MKIISYGKISTGLSNNFYSSCITFGLEPKRSLRVPSCTKLISHHLLASFSKILPSVLKFDSILNR